MKVATTISKINSLDNIPSMPETDAPRTLRIPIPLVRLSTVYDTSANNPRQAMANEIAENTMNTFEKRSSDRYCEFRASTANSKSRTLLGKCFFHVSVAIATDSSIPSLNRTVIREKPFRSKNMHVGSTLYCREL